MPVYRYRCDYCNVEWEAFRIIEKRAESLCCCGRIGRIIITSIAKPVIYDGYNEGLGAYITGPQQKRNIMRQKGLEEVF